MSEVFLHECIFREYKDCLLLMPHGMEVDLLEKLERAKCYESRCPIIQNHAMLKVILAYFELKEGE